MGSLSAAWLALNADPYLGLAPAPFIGLGFGILSGIVITRLKAHSYLATIATALIFSGTAKEYIDAPSRSERALDLRGFW